MSQETDPLKIFEAEFTAGLEENLPFLIEADMFSEPRPLDPSSLDITDLTYDYMSQEELGIVKKTIFKHLGINRQTDSIEKYESKPSPDSPDQRPIQAEIFKTNIENMYLQELTSPDTRQHWLFGPNIHI